MLTVLTGCGKTPYDGKWAYIHDDKTTALTINGNKAEVDGIKCSVKVNGDELELTGKDGSRYVVGPSDTEGQVVLYKFTTYEYQGDGEPDSIIGIWQSDEKWSFEFTEDGTFREDGYFPGFYLDNKDEHSVMLVYNDHFTDTTCKYSIEGRNLIVEYPWPMVQAAK